MEHGDMMKSIWSFFMVFVLAIELYYVAQSLLIRDKLAIAAWACVFAGTLIIDNAVMERL